MHSSHAEISTHETIADTSAIARAEAAQHHLRFATTHLGQCLSPGAKILDFGCGIGGSVSVLLAQGYDAYGVDIREYWGRDLKIYWDIKRRPHPDVAARLKLLDPQAYRLPFEDDTFDFCFSDQVFEHIFDYRAVMSEIVRVLKPGAISCHRFPGPNYPMEGHINVPLPWLCYSRSYLALWALLAQARGREANWRDRVDRDADLMRRNNYPTKARLHSIARSAGAEISFFEAQEFAFRGGGRFGPFLERLRGIGLDRLVVGAAGLMMQRYMVLRAG
jgi:SAM-dependent methyltransferase